MSDNVQLLGVTFGNVARAVACYGSACSSLRGVPEMLHSLFDWIQSVPERLVPAADGARLVYRVDTLLFLRIACEFEPLELRGFVAL